MFSYYLLSPLIGLLSKLPSTLLFWVGNGIAFLLNKIIGYRKKVVRSNIQKAFPDFSEKELTATVNQFYKILGEHIVEAVTALSFSREEILKRCSVKDLSVVQNWSREGYSIVALLGHSGSWEWAGLTASIVTDYPQILALYNPPNNTYWDAWIKRSRERFGMRLVSMHGKNFIKYYKEKQTQKTIHLYVADQSPRGLQGAIWCDFLNSRLPFFSGAARYAVANDCKVLFVKVVRKKRGFHQIEIVPITTEEKKYSAEEITTRFAQLLEAQIQSSPADYLWSHKRWKHEGKELPSKRTPNRD